MHTAILGGIAIIPAFRLCSQKAIKNIYLFEYDLLLFIILKSIHSVSIITGIRTPICLYWSARKFP
jgi:hypothetical protein